MGRSNRPLLYIVTVSIFLFTAIILSLLAGDWDITRSLFSHIMDNTIFQWETPVILSLRINRTIMAVTVGASLALSGTILQSLYRNHLAEPYLIGISGGAALGTTVGIVTGLPIALIVSLSFAGSLGVTLLTTFLFFVRNQPAQTQILTGISLNIIASSCVMIIHTFSDASKVHAALIWLMGDLSAISGPFLMGSTAFLLFIVVIIFFHHKELDILSMDEDFSRNLGVGKVHQMTLFTVAALLAALSVSLAGLIGFVGLMAPHITRRFTTGKHIYLIPGSALTGAFLLLFADTMGKSILPPFEIPPGIITGLIGGIFFILLVVKK